MDSAGNAQWYRRYGSGGETDEYFPGSVIQTGDGGYAVAGTRCLGDSSNIMLMKTDALGESLWTRTYAKSYGEWETYGNAILMLPNGDYIIGGTGADSTARACLIRTDSNGNARWIRHYGSGAGQLDAVLYTSSGGFIAAGTDGNGLLIKTDSLGIPIWTRHFGGACGAEIRSVLPTLDRGLILAGERDTDGLHGRDVYIIKTDSLGCAAIAEKPSPSVRSPLALTAWPSLTTGATTLSCLMPEGINPARLEIRDITGRLVRSFAIPHSAYRTPHSLVWDGSDDRGHSLPSGCYFCTLREGTRTAKAKVLLAR